MCPTPSSPRAPHGAALPLDAWASQATALHLEGVELEVRVLRPIGTGGPLNAVARGLLGARLREGWCLTRAPTCQGCAETLRCDFARVFDTPAALVPGAHGSHGTHPFWLQGLPAVDALPTGVHLRPRIATVGFARAALATLDQTLRVALAQLALGGVEVLSTRRFEGPVPAPRSEDTTCRITALTPLVLGGDLERSREDCPDAPWLPLVVRAGVGRLTGLLRGYLPDHPPAPVRFPDLRGITRIDGRLQRWTARRRSARQGRDVPLEGWVGSAVVRGDAVALLAPLLGALAAVNVGKATTMGFGHLEVASP